LVRINLTRVIGSLLLAASISIIIISYAIIFLNYKLEIFKIYLPPILLKIINFVIILLIFGFLGYVAINMILTTHKAIEAGPPGFEPGTYGSLPRVKSPSLYLAKLRAR
jgi:flagellar biosynthesis protein FlhB